MCYKFFCLSVYMCVWVSLSPCSFVSLPHCLSEQSESSLFKQLLYFDFSRKWKHLPTLPSPSPPPWLRCFRRLRIDRRMWVALTFRTLSVFSGLWRVWLHADPQRCPSARGRASDGQDAHGLRQNSGYNQRAEGQSIRQIFRNDTKKLFFIFCGSHNQSTPLALLEAKQVPQILNTLESKKYIHFPSKFKQNWTGSNSHIFYASEARQVLLISSIFPLNRSKGCISGTLPQTIGRQREGEGREKEEKGRRAKVSFCFCLYVSMSFCLSISLSLCLSVSVPLYLCPSLSL